MVKVTLLEGQAHSGEFEQWRKNGKFVDVVLKCTDGEVTAHQMVLAARNMYFSKLLLSSSENTEEQGKPGEVVRLEIPLEESKDVIHPIVEYIYTGHCDSPPEHYMNLYKAADKYNADLLKALLANRLASDVTLDNVVELTKIAWDYDDEVLKETLVPLMRENITKLKEREDFRELVDRGGYGQLMMKLLEVGN